MKARRECGRPYNDEEKRQALHNYCKTSWNPWWQGRFAIALGAQPANHADVHDHAQRPCSRSSLQLLWLAGSARPLPQTMDGLGSEQSSDTMCIDVSAHEP